MVQQYIISTVIERALPGTDHTHTRKTTNNRLPSRSTDTESDYQHSEWLLLIEKRENRARARTHYFDDYNTAAAAWRSRTHYDEQLRVNGSDKWVQCCRIRVEYGLRWKRVIIVHTSARLAASQHDNNIIVILLYE